MMSVPRIGFDALFLEQPMTGAGQYSSNLWQQLRDREDAFVPWLLAPGDMPPSALEAAGSRFVSTATPPSNRLRGRGRKVWWEQRGVVAAARVADVALVHVPYFAAPLRQTVPHVVTIHDVIPFAMPAYADAARMRLYLRLVARAARRARLILTDSDYSRLDIERHLGIPSERVRVTPLAVGAEFRPATTDEDRRSIERTRAKYGLTRPFVLNVGGFDLRKRLPQLARGFAAALPRLPEPYDLVLPGRAHTSNPVIYPPLAPLIQELGIADHVRMIGFVSEEEKRDLYRAAALFAFASEYEGFGLDPLEALASGAPVVCSNRASLPEVVGDAGLLIDPEPDAISHAIVAVLSNPGLRSDLAARGPRRAAMFSWERTAQLTCDAYRVALSESPMSRSGRWA